MPTSTASSDITVLWGAFELLEVLAMLLMLMLMVMLTRLYDDDQDDDHHRLIELLLCMFNTAIVLQYY